MAVAPMKKCRICGDKALAFNFNGLSCESCKSFFRRNSLRQKELSCLQGGNCEIDKSTRKYCPRCRLDKCLAIGMKKELVGLVIYGCVEKYKKIGRRMKLKENVAQSVLQEEIPQYLLSKHEENQLFCFSTFEQKLFDEVKRASDVFLHKPCGASNPYGEPNLLTTLNLQETYISKLLEFCKRIDAFHCLKVEDQLIVLREFFSDSLAINCAYYCDVKKDGFIDEFFLTNPFLKLDLVFPSDKRKNLDVYRNFIYSLHSEIDSDQNIRDLLMTMFLFRPAIKDNISCPEFLRYHYFVYCRIFLHYLQRKYRDEHKAAQKYFKLMHFIDRMWIPHMFHILEHMRNNIQHLYGH